MAIYDDATNKITLSPEELNNYSFTHLYDAIQNLSNGSLSCVYNSNSLTGSLGDNGGQYDHKVIKLSRSFYGVYTEEIYFGLEEPIFTYNNTYDHSSSFAYQLEIAFGLYYDTVKSAIQLDIKENQITLPDIVDTEDDESETPSTLVGDNLGLLTSQEEIDALLSYRKHTRRFSKLTPNPAGFGFTKQYKFNELPDPGLGEPNVLYLICVYNNGVLIGYRPYRWTPTEGYVRVFNTNTPDLKAEDGGQETPRREIVAPQEAPEKVFNGLVAFNTEPKIKGKKLTDFIDQEGGVTQEELTTALSTKQNTLVSGTNIKTINSQSILGSGNINIPTFEVGDVINLGTINLGVQDDADETPYANFVKELTTAQYNAIPDNGLCIVMFNTTCIIIPYVKAQKNRFVCNAIYDTSGNAMVARGYVQVANDEAGKVARVIFDTAFATAARTGSLPNTIYGVIRFIGF